jgi:predicted DNA-binding transcriptional regulator AlpA
MDTPNDLITTKEARALLGVSPLTMARILRDGTLRHFPNPIDKRQKLVSKGEVLALKPKRAEAA